MGLSSGYMGQFRVQERPKVWNVAVLSSGITLLAFAVYGGLAGINFTSARAAGSAIVAMGLAFVAHFTVARSRALRIK